MTTNVTLPNHADTNWDSALNTAVLAIRDAADAGAAAAAAKYTKPGSGIPASDLATAVQALLTAAGTALQAVAAANISDSTAVGRSLIKAVDAPTARTAIGAGTSSVVVGTGSGQAADAALTLASIANKLDNSSPISVLNAVAQDVMVVWQNSDATWNVRPTSRTDIAVLWIGPGDGLSTGGGGPIIITSGQGTAGLGGYLQGKDVWLQSPS